jgi:hypothetical protein
MPTAYERPAATVIRPSPGPHPEASAADATASPKLRVALDAAARDDDALDERLSELDDTARGRR